MAATSANVRSRFGEALTASPVKGGAAQFGLHKKRYTDSGTRWQVVAFRAVRDGDLKVMRELAFEQPGLLITGSGGDGGLNPSSSRRSGTSSGTRRASSSPAPTRGARRSSSCWSSARTATTSAHEPEADRRGRHVPRGRHGRVVHPRRSCRGRSSHPRARRAKAAMQARLEELSHIERYDVPDPDGGAPRQKTRRVSETPRAKVTLRLGGGVAQEHARNELKYRAVNDYDGRSDGSGRRRSCAARRRRSPASCRTSVCGRGQRGEAT